MAGNKIVYGLEQVHVAFRKIAEVSAPEWDEPIAIEGAVKFAPTPEGEEVKFYADNRPYFTLNVNNGYTAELEMALIPEDILATMLGWEIDDNGMLVESADAKPRRFALMGQIDGDSKNRRFVYYDCLAARPTKEHSTRGETLDPATDVLNLTIEPIKIDGVSVVRGTMELSDTNQTAYDAFFDAVVAPEPKSVDKAALAATLAIADKLTQGDYTEGSWTVFAGAKTTATTVDSDAQATQQQVNNANAKLQAAMLALVVD